jgi:hypothetical protein
VKAGVREKGFSTTGEAVATAKAELVEARMNKDLAAVIERNAAAIERTNASFEKTVREQTAGSQPSCSPPSVS